VKNFEPETLSDTLTSLFDVLLFNSRAGFIIFGHHAEEWVSVCGSYDSFYVYMGESALMGVTSYIYGTNISAALDIMSNAMNGW